MLAGARVLNPASRHVLEKCGFQWTGVELHRFLALGSSTPVDRFKLATIAPSLGGVETLVEQPALMSYHELDDEGLLAMGIAPGLVRLAVGVEETEAVVTDVLEALG